MVMSSVTAIVGNDSMTSAGGNMSGHAHGDNDTLIAGGDAVPAPTGAFDNVLAVMRSYAERLPHFSRAGVGSILPTKNLDPKSS
jgi:hypothetical protein